jgi:hypothetical protein
MAVAAAARKASVKKDFMVIMESSVRTKERDGLDVQ